MQALWLSVVAAITVAGCQHKPASRDRAVRGEFHRFNACPANGNTSGACPGFEVDHIIALCAGGADKPSNMQWLSIEAHRRKTIDDIRHCRKN